MTKGAPEHEPYRPFQVRIETKTLGSVLLFVLCMTCACIAAPTVELRNATGLPIVATSGDQNSRTVEVGGATRFKYDEHLNVSIGGRWLSYDMPRWVFNGRLNPWVGSIGFNGSILVLRLEPDGTLRALPPANRRQGVDVRAYETQPPEFPVRPKTP